MLLELIEHQEELFAAIIGTLNYCSLSALRTACKTLFATISGAHRWQHMHNFAPSLRQINSICRVILRYSDNDFTTILYRNGNVVGYRVCPVFGTLNIYNNSTDYTPFDNAKGIDVYDLTAIEISDIDPCDHIPVWLSECINNHIDPIFAFGSYEKIIDIRP
jgi:hypothetical protein